MATKAKGKKPQVVWVSFYTNRKPRYGKAYESRAEALEAADFWRNTGLEAVTPIRFVEAPKARRKRG
jgi:hypothetical protein